MTIVILLQNLYLHLHIVALCLCDTMFSELKAWRTLELPA